MNEFAHLITSLPISTRDIVTLVPIFLLVGLLFHFSNKEMKKSLEQSKRTHELLSKDRELLQKELQDTKAIRLQELARAAEFGRLAQGLFHDLMTPLTSIVLHTERLKDAEKAVDASRKMATYIKDMRATLSREEAERVCSLSEELETVLHLLSYQAREKGVTVSVVKIEELLTYSSPTKLRQVFSNLILNSIDSFEEVTDTRKKEVKISLGKKADTIMFTVNDNGSGIPREVQEKIFEPFFTTKSHDKGSGLGLTTVKSIVEKYLQGTIGLESTEGRGTRVYVSFPVDSKDPDASPQPPHSAPRRV